MPSSRKHHAQISKPDFFATMEDEELVERAVAFWNHMSAHTAVATSSQTTIPHGSHPGRRKTRERCRQLSHDRIMLDYFLPSGKGRSGFAGEGPVHEDDVFERRFRMSRALFQKIYNAVVADNSFLRAGLNPDATGTFGVSPQQKVVAAMRQLTHGVAANITDDYCALGKSTALRSLKEFCTSVVRVFGPVYLREPNEKDIQRIEAAFGAVGFPGCIGALDCAGWQWHRCPKELQGTHVGKEGKPMLRLEAICDLDLYVWHCMFGLPGMLNDLNILDLSPHFAKVLAGTFPPVSVSYKINVKFNWLYYLVDGIYPNWKVFAKTLSAPGSEKEKTYCERQESVRKCVERLFGVLFKRFHILTRPARLRTVEEMNTIFLACVCVHNMIVEERRDAYTMDGAGGARNYRELGNGFGHEAEYVDAELVPLSASEGESLLNRLVHMACVSDDTKSVAKHNQLIDALIEHNWKLFGDKAV